MLVLTRKIHQAIVVGDNVRVVVLEVDRDQVKLGIDAPVSVEVRRAELPAMVRPGGGVREVRPGGEPPAP